MSAHGASELKEFFMGTRSGDVITKVESDVFLITENAKFKGFTQVLFPIDFDIISEKAQIKLLYVTKSRIPLCEEVEIQQKQLVQRLSLMLPNPISFHSVISRKVENGVQIFADSIGADLIIMISKDYGLLQKLFFDTTVEEVSFDTRIPLLSLQG